MIAYIDIISGISGDMFLASLIDAGFPSKKLVEELKKLGIDFEMEVRKEGDIIKGSSVYIYSEDKKQRKLRDIIEIIDKSDIDNDIKEKAKGIFRRLAEAEAKIHGTSIDKIHFHELGAVDTIIDIVGSLIALKGLDIEKLYSSPVVLGRGKIECEHGVLPAPAPATLELLKGKPVVFSDVPTEITTPTGAALLGLAEFVFPEMEVEGVGYGVGKKKLGMPNILRVVIGKEVDKGGVYIIETNIDDMIPEMYPYVIDRLMKAGALDAYILPIIMKKGRNGVMLKVISTHERMEEIKKILFEETTTFGIRYFKARREKLKREIKEVKTKYGNVRVKIGYYNGKPVSISPEYEDCKKIAMEKGIAIKEIYKEAKEKAKI